MSGPDERGQHSGLAEQSRRSRRSSIWKLWREAWLVAKLFAVTLAVGSLLAVLGVEFPHVIALVLFLSAYALVHLHRRATVANNLKPLEDLSHGKSSSIRHSTELHYKSGYGIE